MKSIGSVLFQVFFLLVSVIVLRIPELKADPICIESISSIFKRVSPSVVFIQASSIDPFKITNRVKSAVGSGFIINKDGLILTNSHLVFGQQLIIVNLENGYKVTAKLIGADPILDLAVLGISPSPDGLPCATLGDSDAAQIGEEVLAIGTPLGLQQTLTRGILSGLNRILSESTLSAARPLIQTDAAINLGSSGGPLLNRCGEVIGINTSAIIGAQNIGFALPINIVKKVLSQLVVKGRVIRPWIGIHGRLFKKEDLAFMNVPMAGGVLVEAVEPGSPAERVGVNGGNLPITIGGTEYLLGGDVITEINGQSLDNPMKIMKLCCSLKVGDKLNLTLYGEMKIRRVEFDLPERPILAGDLPSDTPRGLFPDVK